jgi:RsiW-degrading membrane proteinase PrsW (M82 family)
VSFLPHGGQPGSWSAAGTPAPPPFDPHGAAGFDPGAPPPKRVDVWRVVWLTVVIVGIAAGGIGVLTFVGWKIGPVALIVGIVAAMLPVPLLVFCFLWLHRYRPAPVRYLALCFGWGAGAATAVSLVVNTLSSQAFEHYHLQEDLVAVLVAPFIEETTKAAGPVLLFWLLVKLRRRTFSGIIDGIVFCGLSATGFAMVENILYIGGLGYAQGAQHGGALVGAAGVVKVFFARIVMAGFAHPLFTLMTGIGIGIAGREANRKVRWLAPIGGLLVAMMLHGSWNLMSVLTKATGRT